MTAENDRCRIHDCVSCPWLKNCIPGNNWLKSFGKTEKCGHGRAVQTSVRQQWDNRLLKDREMPQRDVITKSNDDEVVASENLVTGSAADNSVTKDVRLERS